MSKITDIVVSVLPLLFAAVLAVAVGRILKAAAAKAIPVDERPTTGLIIGRARGFIVGTIVALGIYLAVILVLTTGVWPLPAEKSAAYVQRANQVFRALMTVTVAGGVLSFLNGAINWYVTAKATGLTAQVLVLRKLINFGAWALVGVLVLSQFGYKVSALLATMGIAGLAVALALQDTLANIFAGIYIVADRSAKTGDYAKLESGEEGFVEEVGWRNTRIRLWANNIVVVPNSKLIQSTFTNYELPAQPCSVYVSCGVGYDSDLDRVEDVTIDTARTIQQTVPGAVADHQPVVRFQQFGDSNIDFIVVLRSQDASSQFILKHEFIKSLHRRYRSEGINISFPVRTVVFGDGASSPSQAIGSHTN